MNKKIISILSVSLLVASLSSISFAQDDKTIRAAAGSPYVISAKAGGVNYSQGNVRVTRKDASDVYLAKGDNLAIGETAVTGESARAEILLNPGSYVRLDSNSRFSLVSTDLNDLQLRLDLGSAIFEVYAGDGFFVTVLTPTSRFYLVKSGVYRIDVALDGTSRIEVRKGKAQVGTRNAKHLKKARAAVVDGNGVVVSKFKRKERDNFEIWSRSRSEALAQANAALRRNTKVRNSIWNDYNSGRFGNYRNSYGLWTYSSAFGGYCYLPFGSTRRTPYGFGLDRNLYSFGFRRVAYYRSRSNSNNSSVSTNGQSITNRVRPAGEKLSLGERKARRQARRTGNSPTSTRRSNSSRRSKSRSGRSSGASGRSRATPRRSSPRPRRSSPPPRRSSSPRRTSKPKPAN